MVNPHIFVPSGLLPVHSFDLYGPMVDSLSLCRQQAELFLLIAAQEGISPFTAKKIVEDYLALARGEPWATGEKKISIINALSEPYRRHPERQPRYKETFYQDGLQVMREILEAGEGVTVFSSKMPDWLVPNLPEDIGAGLNVYAGNKQKPEAFQRVYAAEMEKKRRMVSHTADELPELEAAVQSGIFANGQGKVIFINRNEQVPYEEALAKGIDHYVNDLRNVGYARMVKK